ncbi:hypothetical protein [Streptomyces sp. NPDC017086]|uniref:hypothetical protein n=1 Tax=Streptomyces sp. NPDC017086 TaxID=3364976 RepID=UPI0037B8E5CF
MPAFSRPPEWQQPADRHSRLSDPVLTVRQLSRFELSLKHVVRIDHALVFATPKGGYDAFLPPHRPTRAEIAARRYTAVYEVDMGVHPFTGTFTLPSDNDAFEFTAEVDFSWQVLDPARFVRSGHRDVPGLLAGTLQQAARPVSRRFAIADSGAAERELLTALTPLEPLGSEVGLQVTWTLRLRRDQAAIEHQQRLLAIDHSAAEQIRVARRGAEIDTELDHRARAQDRLHLERAMDYGRQHQELALQQQHWQQEQAMLHGAQQHQLAVQQAQHALAMQQYEAQKVAFYQWHLQQGGVQAWALHLAEHPQDTGLVMTAMREDQLRMIQAQMDLVKELLAGDNAEKFELEGPKQLALRTVTDILNQRLPGVAQNPPLVPPGPAPGAGPVPGAITDGTAVSSDEAGDAQDDDEAPAGKSPSPGAAENPPVPAAGQDAEAGQGVGQEAVPQVPPQPSYTPPHTPPYTPPYPPRQAPYTPAQVSYATPQPPYAPPHAPYSPPQPPYATAQTPYAAPQPPYTAPQPPYAAPQAPYVPRAAQPAQEAAAAPAGYPAQPGGWYPPPMPTAPPAPAGGWQPPPGYGSVPTAPPQPPAAGAPEQPLPAPEGGAAV